jgi:hypothetical protein
MLSSTSRPQSSEMTDNFPLAQSKPDSRGLDPGIHSAEPSAGAALRNGLPDQVRQ